MTEPRGVDERIRWFLDHTPSGPGMCAQHSWHSLGGDNGSVPAWGCSDANEVYDKVKKAGRYWTSPPPRGALVLYRYGNNGHAAIEHTAGARIATTNPDPDNPAGTATGVEDNDYPAKWGASKGSAIWTDTYNGVRFPVGDEEDDMALSDEDIEKIARAVWQYDKALHTSLNLDGTTDDEPSYRSAQDALYDTRYRAIRGPA